MRSLFALSVFAAMGLAAACGSGDANSGSGGPGGGAGGGGPGSGAGPGSGGSAGQGGHLPPPDLTPVKFQLLADDAPDLVAPFRAAEFWNGVYPGVIDIPVDGQDAQFQNAYNRFNWYDFEDTVSGQYDFTSFDNNVHSAIASRRAFSFGIMPVCEGCSHTVDGYELGYPSYLHDLMQNDAVPDWSYQDVWVPNWNSESYLSRWEALLNALAAHIDSSSNGGFAYKDVIDYVDIRGYGNYGEWHVYPWYQSIPNGAAATASTLLRIVNAHVTAFPKVPLVAMIAGFDDGGANLNPREVTHFLLTSHNDWGPFGWRRDNWGDPGYSQLLEMNTESYQGDAFAPLIMNKWKTSPIVGEPLNSSASVSNGGDCDFYQFVDEVTLYHATSFGNGNIPDPGSTCAADNVRAASKASGYRLVLDGGGVTSKVGKGRLLAVELDWHNIGLAPPYNDWKVVFALRDGSGKVAWTGTSSVKLRGFLPAKKANAAVDEFTLPASVASGAYTLVLTAEDAAGYRVPLPLAIEGRASDGSYEVAKIVVK